MERWKGLYVPMGQGEQGVRPLGEEVPGAHVDAQQNWRRPHSPQQGQQGTSFYRRRHWRGLV